LIQYTNMNNMLALCLLIADFILLSFIVYATCGSPYVFANFMV